LSGDDRGEREKLSWSEIDKLRGRARKQHDDRPRGREARERAARERRGALAAAAELFSGEAGGARGAQLATAVRAAHSTPGLAEACQAYVDELGMPESAELLSIFLDLSARDWRVRSLEALCQLQSSGTLEISAGLRSQLRVLREDADDEVAGLAEDLLP